VSRDSLDKGRIVKGSSGTVCVAGVQSDLGLKDCSCGQQAA
jgi:hypothetical protein